MTKQKKNTVETRAAEIVVEVKDRTTFLVANGASAQDVFTFFDTVLDAMSIEASECLKDWVSAMLSGYGYPSSDEAFEHFAVLVKAGEELAKYGNDVLAPKAAEESANAIEAAIAKITGAAFQTGVGTDA